MKKQEKSLLTCSWGCIKTPPISLDLRNDLLNHTPSRESGLSFNHQTKSSITVEPHRNVPWDEAHVGWKDPADVRAESLAVAAAFLPAQISRLSGARWRVASPEHLQEERLFLPFLSFQLEMGEAEPWQEGGTQSAAGIYCNPATPVMQTDPCSPAVSLCVFPYLQSSSFLETPESSRPLSSPRLHPPGKVSVWCSGCSGVVLPFARTCVRVCEHI